MSSLSSVSSHQFSRNTIVFLYLLLVSLYILSPLSRSRASAVKRGMLSMSEVSTRSWSLASCKSWVRSPLYTSSPGPYSWASLIVSLLSACKIITKLRWYATSMLKIKYWIGILPTAYFLVALKPSLIYLYKKLHYLVAILMLYIRYITVTGILFHQLD